jgi:clan AA aspartic protease
MIQGVVTADREAVVRLQILDAAGNPTDLDVVIDTGFNGYMTLPMAIIRQHHLALHGTRSVTLGDGTQVMLDIYRATILWMGQPRTVQALAAEGGALIGMALLYGSEVSLRVLDGGPVTITPIP